MSKIKKCLAVLVCMAMALAVMPGVALAEERVTADGLVYGVYFDYVTITGYTGNATELEIPSEIDGFPVTIINHNAFYYCNNLTSVTIPSSVTAICRSAFSYCTSLISVTIPDSVTSIDYGTFLHCDSLTSVTIPDSITAIDSESFGYCNSLTSVTIPNSVTSIGDRAFKDCGSLTSVTIPDSVAYIGNGAFEYCDSLTNMIIGNSVIIIDDGAFKDCDNLTSVTIPESVTSIGDSAFGDCSTLTNVYYAGSAEDWANIDIGDGNDTILNATIHYNSTGPSPEIKVTVNGAPVDFDVPPMAIDGTTMLPVRYALEPLGAEFVWDGEAQTVTITAKGKTIVLTIGSATALVDGVEKTMAQPAMANDGRTLIPIRFVSEELGYDVQWDGETNTVIING